MMFFGSMQIIFFDLLLRLKGLDHAVFEKSLRLDKKSNSFPTFLVDFKELTFIFNPLTDFKEVSSNSSSIKILSS